MKLGAFSVSLAVKDINASRAFYEALGFTELGPSGSEHYCMLKNGDAVIGLFQGMFEGNILTFNPGWNQDAQPADPFDDVRAIERSLEAAGIPLIQKTDPASNRGPAHITLVDPDGNAILIDQHR